jgi:hypothetical protein
MRRALALATLTAFAASAALPAIAAEGWTKYTDGANGLSWSVNDGYTYKDRLSGRLVIMQAVSKGAMGPNSPGAADGVGNVVAIDCTKKNMISLGSYKPGADLQIKDNWRSDTPKRADGAENEALLGKVCPMESKAPVK